MTLFCCQHLLVLTCCLRILVFAIGRAWLAKRRLIIYSLLSTSQNMYDNVIISQCDIIMLSYILSDVIHYVILLWHFWYHATVYHLPSALKYTALLQTQQHFNTASRFRSILLPPHHYRRPYHQYATTCLLTLLCLQGHDNTRHYYLDENSESASKSYRLSLLMCFTLSEWRARVQSSRSEQLCVVSSQLSLGCFQASVPAGTRSSVALATDR